MYTNQKLPIGSVLLFLVNFISLVLIDNTDDLLWEIYAIAKCDALPGD